MYSFVHAESLNCYANMLRIYHSVILFTVIILLLQLASPKFRHRLLLTAVIYLCDFDTISKVKNCFSTVQKKKKERKIKAVFDIFLQL